MLVSIGERGDETLGVEPLNFCVRMDVDPRAWLTETLMHLPATMAGGIENGPVRVEALFEQKVWRGAGACVLFHLFP